MIRKVVLLATAAFILFWLAGAHLAKTKVIAMLDKMQSDNVKITYEDASISGFPFRWQVDLDNLDISLTNELKLRNFSSKQISFVFDFSLSKSDIFIDENIYLKLSKLDNEEKYLLQSQDKIKVQLEFKQPLYFVDSDELSASLIKEIKFENTKISGRYNGDEAFIISRAKLHSQQSEDDISNMILKFTGDYQRLNDIFLINNAALVLDIGYHVNDSLPSKTTRDFDQMLKINQAKLNFDGAMLELQGHVKLSRNNVPAGEFLIAMHKYDDVVENLIPDDFILSKPYLKKLLSKIMIAEEKGNLSPDDVSFRVQFSNQGFSIGKLNLFELQELK